MGLLASASARATMPVNPDRPLARPSCAEALERLREARAGSPLLGAAENRAALRRARRVARRLCGGENGPR